MGLVFLWLRLSKGIWLPAGIQPDLKTYMIIGIERVPIEQDSFYSKSILNPNCMSELKFAAL